MPNPFATPLPRFALLAALACGMIACAPKDDATQRPPLEAVLGGGQGRSTPTPAPTARPTPPGPSVDPARGLPAGEWLYHPGDVAALGDLAAVGRKYAFVAIDADPSVKRATSAQIAALQAGGAKVLTIASLASADRTRPSWKQAVLAIDAAETGPRSGTNEVWIDPSNTNYYGQLNALQIGPAIKAGADGMLLMDADIVSHLAEAAEAPCDSGCRSGVAAEILQLRRLFPKALMVVAGGDADGIRLGTAVNNLALSTMIDGVVATGVYQPAYDPAAEARLAAWKGMGLSVAGKPFFLGTLDAVPGCAAGEVSDAAAKARAQGFAPAVRDPGGATPCPLP